MKIVVTGATGNAGTCVVPALAGSEAVDRIVGLARRRPEWDPPKTEWVEADIVTADLAKIFRGADAVIHLAWAIQPSHEGETLERTNVEGSKRVFDAVAKAEVPRLVYASSVGAYSKGPKDEAVDESWPTEGTPSSFYSRHKVAVERLLDAFEERNPETTTIRLRPALIFRDEAATEIHRLFVGPLLPRVAMRLPIPALPRVDGLVVQGVHSEDVGRAYLRAVLADTSGAFNIAADPPLSSTLLSRRIGPGRTFPVPRAVVRALADVSWRLRLQPTPAGWFDMALAVPLMSTKRAREELGWAPRHDAVEAVEELLHGMQERDTFPTPPLSGEGPEPGRGEQIVRYLTDVHSIEEQALTQMKAAPRIAGEGHLAQAFERHRGETEAQERRVRERIEAIDADPSKIKDLAGIAGGVGMVAFAGSQPDTPGKLLMHAYSYEHMEIAAYELLRRLAERSEDEQTAEMAKQICDEEREMADRLADCFDEAVDASLGDAGRDEVRGGQLLTYIRDAHALEIQAIRLLESGSKSVEDPELAATMARHLEETLVHRDRLERLLESRDESPSTAKDAGLALGGINLSAFFGAQPDTTTKLAGFAYAFEHLEIAAYELLERVAVRAGADDVIEVAERTLGEERAAAEAVAKTWDRPRVPLGTAS